MPDGLTHLTLITDGMWPLVTGGMQTHSFYLCKYLASLGVRVRVYHPGLESGNSIKSEFSTEQWQHMEWIGIHVFKKNNLPGAYLFKNYLYSRAVNKHLKNDPPKTACIYAKGLTAWALTRPWAAPLLINIHGYEMFQQAPDFKHAVRNQLLLKPLFKYVLKKNTALISYGPCITNIIHTHFGTSQSCIELAAAIPKSEIRNEITKVESIRRIVFLGRFEKRKGLQHLFNCIKQYQNTPQISNIEFHIIGPIPESQRFKHKQIHYHGLQIKREALFALLDQMDALLCPSISEGMPNVILEAMARGLCIITTAVGSIPDMLNHHEAIWITRCNANGIMEALTQFSDCTADQLMQYKSMALNAVSRRFTWEHRIIETQKKLLTLPNYV